MINTTSSIGASWPPAEASFERMRGFYPAVIEGHSHALELTEEYREAQAAVEKSSDLSRLSLRAVADLELVDALPGVEGILPVRGSDTLGIVYMGWNSPTRAVEESRYKQHGNRLNEITGVEIRTGRSMELRQNGITPRVIDLSTIPEERLEQVPLFRELYGRFNYDEADVKELLLNPDNIIAYIVDDEGIVSTAMAEHATLSIDGINDLRIAEITEAATRSGCEGQGYYGAVSGYLTEMLRGAEVPLDVIYGESNLAMRGVLRAAHDNGRRFSYYDAQKYGVHSLSFGILPQNFSVDDGSEQRAYNDFALSYVPLQ